MPTPNAETALDVIIPILEKDLAILPLCIEGLRSCVQHTIKNIYLISSNNENIKQFAEKNQLKFINEKEVLGYGAEQVGFITSNGRNRSGWIFQQLLKLSAQIGTERFFLVIDADHILIRPHTFITHNNKYVTSVPLKMGRY
ncbi:DUF6492 family protein [Bacteroides nordii]|uniref:DUF6492 family protein n=1 Tax=Bacteroides nordii TaxID=291645 RepID=UPI0035216EBD